MSFNMAEQLWYEISRINNNHISKLRSKFRSLCNKSCWKDLSRVGLVNISNVSLSSVETEALSFGLKFATRIRNHEMGKLINTNYRHHDSNFYKGFIQGIIATSTNCHTDELTLPNRYIASLKSLSLLFHLLTKVDVLLLWILRSITKILWIFLVISHMNRYPYKLF